MIHPICLLTFELIFRLFGDSRTDNCTTDWSHPAEWSALRLPLGRLNATSARPIAMLAIVAVLLAPSSRNGAATSQAPNATLTNRRARATSAVAMMATVITSAPTSSEEHTSELQSLMRSSNAVCCLKQKHKQTNKD